MNKEKIGWILIDVVGVIVLFASFFAILFGGRLGVILGLICASIGFVVYEWLQSKRPVYLTYR